MFFHDRALVLRPISQIALIEPVFDKGENEGAIVTMLSGEVCRVTPPVLEDLSELPNASFAAQTGTYMIGLNTDEDGVKTAWKVPVVGFVVTCRNALPVTAGGICHGVQNEYAILHPDGSVVHVFGDYADVAAFLEAKHYEGEDLSVALTALA